MYNPHCNFSDGPIYVIPEEMIDILYKRTNFLKKLIEEMSTEESIRLLRFVIWENPDVTVLILSEIVAYVRFSLLDHRELVHLFAFYRRSPHITVMIRERTTL